MWCWGGAPCTVTTTMVWFSHGKAKGKEGEGRPVNAAIAVARPPPHTDSGLPCTIKIKPDHPHERLTRQTLPTNALTTKHAQQELHTPTRGQQKHANHHHVAANKRHNQTPATKTSPIPPEFNTTHPETTSSAPEQEALSRVTHK